jgi:hypothetical protein
LQVPPIAGYQQGSVSRNRLQSKFISEAVHEFVVCLADAGPIVFFVKPFPPILLPGLQAYPARYTGSQSRIFPVAGDSEELIKQFII